MAGEMKEYSEHRERLFKEHREQVEQRLYEIIEFGIPWDQIEVVQVPQPIGSTMWVTEVRIKREFNPFKYPEQAKLMYTNKKAPLSHMLDDIKKKE